ncbi:APC family permease [Rhodococcus koreensis]|uniref:APC family permease n=1 Tax=Rhodococcus koreensis TaxID=99653 RepID=UPI003672592B
MTDMELPAGDDDHLAALQSESLSMAKAMGMGAAYIAPCVIMISTTAGIALTAGSGSWLAVLLDIPVLICLVAAIAVFARRYIVTGSLMSYLGDAFGEKSRIVSGSPLIIGYLALMPVASIFTLIFAQGLLLDLEQSWANAPSAQVGVIAALSLLAGYIAYRGVELSARWAIGATLVSVPFVLIVLVATLLHNNVAWDTALTLKGVHLSDLTSGLVLAFTGLVGFEGFTALGRETRDPVRNIPRILYFLVALVVALILLGCLVFAPVLLNNLDAINAGESPSAILANAAGVGLLNVPLDASLTVGAFACMIAVFNAASRIIATAATDGMLPSWLGRISPKSHTPARAVAILGIFAVGVPALSQFVVRQSPMQAMTAISPTLIYLWLFPYAAMCVGLVALKRRDGKLVSIASSAGVFGFVFIAWLLVYNVTHVTGTIQRVAPIIGIGLAALLLIVSLGRTLGAPRRRSTPQTNLPTIVTAPSLDQQFEDDPI